MEKVKARFFRGIEFIRLVDVPEEQYDHFLGWLDRKSIINIQVEREVHKDCVQYSEYSFWFEQVLNESKDDTADSDSTRTNDKSIGLAFGDSK